MLIIIFHIRATVMWQETELFVHEYALGDRLLSRDLNALTRQTTNHRQVKTAAKTRNLPRRHIVVFQLTGLRRIPPPKDLSLYKLWPATSVFRASTKATRYFISHLLVVQEQ